MPIYEQSYRKYDAREPLRTVRFWPITREALRLVLVKRAFLGLLAIGWLPFIVRVIQIYIVTRFPEATRLLPVDERLFGEFVSQQFPFVFLLSIFGGSGLIANDLRSGAILVYLSRPLSRRDYVLGKLSVLLTLNLFVTLAPGLALYGVGLALAPGHLLKWSLVWVAPAIVAYALVIAFSVSLLALAVSALSRSARVAGLGFFGLLVVLELARIVSSEIYRAEALSLLSIQANLRTVGGALFGFTGRDLGAHWGLAGLVLTAVGLACLAVLRARVRAVEIVR